MENRKLAPKCTSLCLAAMDRIGYNWDKMTELYRIVVLRIGASLLAVLLAALALAGLRRAGLLLLRRLKPFARKLSIAPMANWHLLTNHEALAASPCSGTASPNRTRW